MQVLYNNIECEVDFTWKKIRKLLNMKNKSSIFVLTLFTFTILLYSCGGDKKQTAADNKLGKLDVEIPASLKDKPEVVAYIHDMNQIADDYADMGYILIGVMLALGNLTCILLDIVLSRLKSNTKQGRR